MSDESDRERQLLADIEAARVAHNARKDDELVALVGVQTANAIISRRGKSQVIVYGGARQLGHSLLIHPGAAGLLKEFLRYTYKPRVEKDITQAVVIVDEARMMGSALKQALIDVKPIERPAEPTLASFQSRAERREMERAERRSRKRKGRR